MMKTFAIFVLLATGLSYSQVPVTAVRVDGSPEIDG